MIEAKLRAWWSHKQGLDGSLAGASAADVLHRTGWSRSVGGAGPYLALFSRAGLRREEVDAAVATMEIHELPSARGCTYILPASDYATGLKAGEPFAGNEMKVASKLGVTDEEIAKLRTAVAQALTKGPLDPEALKAAVGDAARNLGPEGVRKGITTTMPVALGLMQSAGEIRRLSSNGRLDQQRYKYALWKPNPLAKWKLSPEDSFVELARLFFRWSGGASIAEFQTFSGLGVKAAKAAVEPLQLEPLADEILMLPGDREAFDKFKTPKHPQYSLVGSLDNICLLRRNLTDLLAHEDAASDLLRTQKGVVDMPNHRIMDRGRLVGLWDFDTATNTIAWMSFVHSDKAMEEAVRKTEAFVRNDLGDARGFSLDSPKSRAGRIETLRKAASA